MSYHIVAIDPGKTTGVAGLHEAGLHEAGWSLQELAPEQVWPFLEGQKPFLKTLIVERFDFRPRIKVDYTPVEVIGVIKEWCRQNLDSEIVWQSPSQAKHFFTNDKLKEMDMYVKSMPHALDAMRHLQYHLKFGAK